MFINDPPLRLPMNPLSHTFVNHGLIEDHNIKCDKNLVYLGGILPDLSILQVIPMKEAHTDSLGFIAYLAEKDPDFLPFGFGFMLHGEAPCGLDSYTHGKGGFIDRLELPVYNIVHKYKPRMFGGRLNLFIHSLIEYSCDTMLPKEPADRLNKAFDELDVPRATFHLANYFKGEGKRIEKILKYFQRFDFHRLRDEKEVARIWRSFQVYQSLGKGSLFQKYSSLTQSLALMKLNPLTKMIQETKELIRKPFFDHVKTSKEGMASSLIRPFPNPLAPRNLPRIV